MQLHGHPSLRSTLCLIYHPKIIAFAAIHVAGKYLEENLNECFGEIWRELYEPDIQEIQGKFLYLYTLFRKAPTLITTNSLSISLNSIDAANEILDQYTMASRGRSYDKVLWTTRYYSLRSKMIEMRFSKLVHVDFEIDASWIKARIRIPGEQHTRICRIPEQPCQTHHASVQCGHTNKW